MKNSVTLLLCITGMFANAQNVGIGTKNPQNKLHVAGGVRIDSLASKKDSGLILHNKTGDLYSISLTGKQSDVLRGDGTFAAAAAATDAWLLGGNAGTDSNTNFIGTTDDRPLRFRVNNKWFGSLGPNVSFGLNSYGFRTQHPEQPSTTEGDNVAIGNWALSEAGARVNQNVAVGSETLRQVHGNRNTAVGYNAVRGFYDPSYNALGSGNTGVGASALFSCAFGNNNTAVGNEALLSNAFGAANVAVGQGSLRTIGAQVTDGAGGNVAVGSLAMYSAKVGDYNTAIGYQAIYSATEPFYATAVGYRALFADQGYGNTAVGAWSMQSSSTGMHNSALGEATLYSNVSGSANCAFGYHVLEANVNGNYNTAAGNGSMLSNTSGSYNCAVGYRALYTNATGKHNTGLGAYALQLNTGEQNSAVGSNALANNSTGINNTAVGYLTMSNNQTGNANTAAGNRALGNNTSGVNNTALGYGALLTNAGGSLNTAVGMLADVASPALSNATAIGYGAKVNASNKVRIGNASVTVIEGQVPFTTPSDGRFKFNVKEDVSGLAFILKLRPVTYQFDVKKFDNTEGVAFVSSNDAYEKAALVRRTGFIAQEVEKAAKEMSYDFSGVIKPESEKGHYSLSYESFVVPLVKAVQEQQEIINVQNKKITDQQQLITEQNRKIEDLIRRIEKIETN